MTIKTTSDFIQTNGWILFFSSRQCNRRSWINYSDRQNNLYFLGKWIIKELTDCIPRMKTFSTKTGPITLVPQYKTDDKINVAI